MYWQKMYPHDRLYQTREKKHFSAQNMSEALRKWVPLALATTSVALSIYTILTRPKQQPSSTSNSNPQQTPKQALNVHIQSNRSKTSSLSLLGPSLPSQFFEHGHISRIMLPDDANSAGNVHGGTILKMIGHVGWIAASRHANHCYSHMATNCT